MTEVRSELPPMPARIARLPVRRGYPVPWFVAWTDDGKEVDAGTGEPDFRVMSEQKLYRAVREQRCWVCGDRLGAFSAFTVGPMCAVNRVSAEPPSHRGCAEWSARACPFLTRPHMARREGGEPKPAGTQAPAGVMIERNPGVSLVWVTKKFSLVRVPNGVLFNIGEPVEALWFAEGREANRAEVEESIRTGLPILSEMAEKQGQVAVDRLERQHLRALELLPA